MPDAQSSSSTEQPDPRPRPGVVDWCRSINSYVGLAVFVMAAVIWSVPGLRDQVSLFTVFNGADASVAEQAPAEVLAAAAVAAAMVDNAQPHAQATSFLSSTGNAAKPAQKPHATKVSAVQAESLGRYIARKYRVSNEATRMLISTAYGVGQEMGLDPLLLLAIIAIESSFNPFAESHVGAQGLMQVLTRVHTERFEPFGGSQAAWNPVANIRVGASILKEYIERGGSLTAGLRMYVGVGPDGSSPYGDRVLAERRRLASAAGVNAELPPGAVPATPARSASAKPMPIPTDPSSEAVSVKNTEPGTPAVM